jgi:hypothetical protein
MAEPVYAAATGKDNATEERLPLEPNICSRHPKLASALNNGQRTKRWSLFLSLPKGFADFSVMVPNGSMLCTQRGTAGICAAGIIRMGISSA